MRRIHFGQIPSHPKIWAIDDWSSKSQVERMQFLRKISEHAGLNPTLATLAVDIFKKYNVSPRDYKKQAEALLHWVQNNIYYVNEPRERLQEPTYTLRVGYGDCDDMTLLLAALCESVRLEYRFVLAGKINGKVDRWIEGTPYKEGRWSHIYLIIGYPPFKPKKWVYAEPTIKTAKLGWDIVQAKNGILNMPELGATISGEEFGVRLIEPPKKKTVLSEIGEGLSLKKFVPAIVLGAITSVAIGELAAFIKRQIKN